jgi:hypothetical protein
VFEDKFAAASAVVSFALLLRRHTGLVTPPKWIALPELQGPRLPPSQAVVSEDFVSTESCSGRMRTDSCASSACATAHCLVLDHGDELFVQMRIVEMNCASEAQMTQRRG